ncbi:hypothetical protein ACYOEI_01180 [Singulisphaera rosea]
MRRPARMLTIILFTGACTSAPPQTLDQRLETVDASERKEILRVACLNEAEWPQRSSIPAGASIRLRAHNSHYLDPRVQDMKDLCGRMDALADAGPDATAEKVRLQRECASMILTKKQDGGEQFAQHAARAQHICEEMLGK